MSERTCGFKSRPGHTRVADGSVLWWDVILSVALLLAAIVVCLAAADPRAYWAGPVRLRRSVSLRHAFRGPERAAS